MSLLLPMDNTIIERSGELVYCGELSMLKPRDDVRKFCNSAKAFLFVCLIFCSGCFNSGEETSKRSGEGGGINPIVYDIDYDLAPRTAFGVIGTEVTGEVHAHAAMTSSRGTVILIEHNGTTFPVPGIFPAGKKVCRFRVRNLPPDAYRLRTIVSGSGLDIPMTYANPGDYEAYWEGEGTANWSLFYDWSGHYYFLDFRGGGPAQFLIFRLVQVPLPIPG